MPAEKPNDSAAALCEIFSFRKTGWIVARSTGFKSLILKAFLDSQRPENLVREFKTAVTVTANKESD